MNPARPASDNGEIWRPRRPRMAGNVAVVRCTCPTSSSGEPRREPTILEVPGAPGTPATCPPDCIPETNTPASARISFSARFFLDFRQRDRPERYMFAIYVIHAVIGDSGLKRAVFGPRHSTSRVTYAVGGRRPPLRPLPPLAEEDPPGPSITGFSRMPSHIGTSARRVGSPCGFSALCPDLFDVPRQGREVASILPANRPLTRHGRRVGVVRSRGGPVVARAVVPALSVAYRRRRRRGGNRPEGRGGGRLVRSTRTREGRWRTGTRQSSRLTIGWSRARREGWQGPPSWRRCPCVP